MLNETYCPKMARNDVLSRKVGNETIVYDPHTAEAACLDEVMSVVWTMCDGKRDVRTLLDEVKRAGFQEVSIHSIWVAIEELAEAGLLVKADDCESKNYSENRREMLRLLGTGAIAVIPALTAISIPSPVAAVSPCFPRHSICSSNSQCCSGRCLPSGKCH